MTNGVYVPGRISLSSTVVATKHQVSCDLAGEAAILDMESGVYYGLNEVGARIWELIQEPKKVTDVCGALLQEFDVEEERCQKDTVVLLESLLTNNLLEVHDGASTQNT